MRAKDEKLTLPPWHASSTGVKFAFKQTHICGECVFCGFIWVVCVCVFAHKSFVLTIVNRRSVQIVKWIKRGGGEKERQTRRGQEAATDGRTSYITRSVRCSALRTSPFAERTKGRNQPQLITQPPSHTLSRFFPGQPSSRIYIYSPS